MRDILLRRTTAASTGIGLVSLAQAAVEIAIARLEEGSSEKAKQDPAANDKL